MALRFFRRSGSRVSIHNPVTAESVLGAPPVSGLTLCPLGQPEKATGHKSQIEPWLASTTTLLACAGNRKRRHHKKHESRRRENLKNLATHRRLDSTENRSAPSSRRGSISLDSPLYRTGLPPKYVLARSLPVFQEIRGQLGGSVLDPTNSFWPNVPSRTLVMCL
jgi:hypothetical protein